MALLSISCHGANVCGFRPYPSANSLADPEPIALGNMASGDNRASAAADLINQATEEVRERDKRRADIELARATATPPRQRASFAGLLIAIPAFVALLVVGFTDWSLSELLESRPSAPAAREQAEKMLDGLVADIEAFRNDYHELPERLIEIGIPARGEWTYSPLSKDHYKIEGALYGQRVSFNSSSSPRRTVKK